MIDTARLARRQFGFVNRHHISLELPKDARAGGRAANLLDLPGIERWIDVDDVSEAVHVSQNGFAPSDPLKLGFFSYWLGASGQDPRTALQLNEPPIFQLVDAASGEVVFEDRSRLEAQADHTSRLNLAPVYALDFSSIDRPGRYRLCVDGACSIDFDIGPKVWVDAFKLAMQGLYYQRSGMAFDKPNHWQRPRALHPEDGFKALQSGPGWSTHRWVSI